MTSWAEVARLRMVAQGLVGEPRPTATDVVAHLTCLQAQDFPQARAAVAIRTAERSIDGVHRALADGEVVRSWPMRGTLHLVPAQDLGWTLDLTRDRMRRQAGPRHAALGITGALRDRVESATRALLSGGGLGRTALIAAWREGGLELDGPTASHLIGALAIDQVIVFGPLDEQTGGREQQLRLTSEWIGHPRRLDRDAAIAQWLLRYLISHGPATIKDFCWWTKLGVSEVRPVQDEVTRQLELLVVDGVELWHAPGLRDRAATLGSGCDRPVLVPGFDEILLGYGDRSATLPTEHADRVVPGHNGVFFPIVLHRGRAVATWRRPAKGETTVAVTAFTDLPVAVRRALPGLSRAYPLVRAAG